MSEPRCKTSEVVPANGYTRYSLAQIVLHWLVVLLIVGQYATSSAVVRVHAYRPFGRPANAGDLALQAIHVRIGLIVLVFVAIRLVLRVAQGAPERSPPLSPFRTRLALGVHYGLYAILLAQALTGMIAIDFWWPANLAHKALFWVLGALIGLHLGGAALSFVESPRETLFRITRLRLPAATRPL